MLGVAIHITIKTLFESGYSKSKIAGIVETVWECKKNIGAFIEKYNTQRLHQSLKQYDTPLEAYLQTQMAVAC